MQTTSTASRQASRGHASGFPPIATSGARVLVLGTMPGVASLRAQRYYAHPRNAFWPIMQALFDIDAGADYGERCARLCACGVAVWDVLAHCERPGSLDADIRANSVVANDFASFFGEHPALRAICFNGATAQALFRRHVAAAIELPETTSCVRLPSTSPAHAGVHVADKLRAWRVVADFCA